jgi:hypothetical protein
MHIHEVSIMNYILAIDQSTSATKAIVGSVSHPSGGCDSIGRFRHLVLSSRKNGANGGVETVDD